MFIGIRQFDLGTGPFGVVYPRSAGGVSGGFGPEESVWYGEEVVGLVENGGDTCGVVYLAHGPLVGGGFGVDGVEDAFHFGAAEFDS